jgi:beta-ureidopropionase
MAKVKCGLIQMALKGDGSMKPDDIRDRMIEAHIPYIEDAAKQGVQILCFQEVFTQPYFCPSQDRKWYAAAEKIPDGYTTKLMQEYAKKYNMVIVVPLYEEYMTGVYYNTAAVIARPTSHKLTLVSMKNFSSSLATQAGRYLRLLI